MNAHKHEFEKSGERNHRRQIHGRIKRDGAVLTNNKLKTMGFEMRGNLGLVIQRSPFASLEGRLRKPNQGPVPAVIVRCIDAETFTIQLNLYREFKRVEEMQGELSMKLRLMLATFLCLAGPA